MRGSYNLMEALAAIRSFACRVGLGMFLLVVLLHSIHGTNDAWGQDVTGAGFSRSPSQTMSVAQAESSGQAGGVEGGTVAPFSPTDKPSGINVKSIEFSPAVPVAKDPISVQVKFDREFGLPPMLSYRWKINGEVVQESSSPGINLPTKRGDVVEVTVFTDEVRDPARTVTAFVKVGGSPPTITRTGEGLDEKGRYVAGYEVQHPDGEPVTVSLSKGPDGMVLDTARKEVSWTVPPGSQGDFPVELVATDPSGGKAICSFSIRIRQEQPKASEKNAPSKP